MWDNVYIPIIIYLMSQEKNIFNLPMLFMAQKFKEFIDIDIFYVINFNTIYCLINY